MSKVIRYHELKDMLTGKYGYSEEDAVYTIARLRGADAETMRGFAEFFDTGDLPERRIHGVRVADVMKARELNPFAAFLAIDWLGEEPQRARFHLTNPVMSLKPGEKVIRHIREVAEQRGWNLDAPPETEDTSDLTIPDFADDPEE